MEDRELKNCNAIKTTMMLIIILYHCVYLAAGDGFVRPGIIIYNRKLYLIVLEWFSSFQNYTFVLVSGYIFSHIFYEKNGYKNIIGFINKKAKRLLVPFISVALVWGIPFSTYFYKLNALEIFYRWVLCSNPDQLWFLIMLFEAFLISRLLIRFYQNYPKLSFFILILLYYVGSVAQIYFLNIFRIFNSFQMLIFFRVGMDLRMKGEDYNVKKASIPTLILTHLILLGVVISPLLFNVSILKYIKILFQLPLRFIGTLLMYLLLQRLFYNVDFENSIMFKTLNENKMTMYLLHQQLVYPIVCLVAGKFNFSLTILIVYCCTVLLTLGLSVLLSKCKYLRIALGGT